VPIPSRAYTRHVRTVADALRMAGSEWRTAFLRAGKRRIPCNDVGLSAGNSAMALALDARGDWASVEPRIDDSHVDRLRTLAWPSQVSGLLMYLRDSV
jgi:hypothetical protein